MEKKLLFIVIGLILTSLALSGCTLTNNTNNNTNKTYFIIDGPIKVLSNETMYDILIPVHKTVPQDQKIWFTYVFYIDGIPTPTVGMIAIPQGIDTTKTFNLEIKEFGEMGKTFNYTAVDILAYADQNRTILLQKVHLNIP
jgi:restriction endonuclease S subunit